VILGKDVTPVSDGNWDDDQEEEDLGFKQDTTTRTGGVVDMADDVYMEFDEDEEPEPIPREPNTWKISARYRANFKPNTHSMFTHFTEDVWHLRIGIRYAERGKNYYMITLFSQGDYDFVMRGGPWIFRQNALLVKDFAVVSRLSGSCDGFSAGLGKVYDVPWEKQNKKWGIRYGNGLGKAVEVDAPTTDQDMMEFLRVRIELPYDQRIQTQLTAGVKGKPEKVVTYRLKYERLPLFCSHCGFMGHRKEVCEKKRQGVPSLEYDPVELRCSPYKKYEYRTHYVPPQGQASAKHGLSFSSFGSAESRKSQLNNQGSQKGGLGSRFAIDLEKADSDMGLDGMPPLEEDVPGYDFG
jgi:hypothetical protein